MATSQVEDKFADLDYTRELRMKIVQELTVDETGRFKLPEDVKEQKTLLTALADIDRSRLGRERIKIEDKVAESNGETAAIIRDMYKHMGQAGHPLKAAEGQATREPPKMPEHLKQIDLIDGETATAPPQGSYESFMTQMSASPSEALNQ